MGGPDFRNSTAKMKNKSRSLSRFIKKYLMDVIVTEPVPPRIQNLIKLVKYWYKKFVPPSQGQNELILEKIGKVTAEVWIKTGKPKIINMAIAFRAVMEELRDKYDEGSPTGNTACDTLKKPMFVDVVVTRNWCRSPNIIAPSAVASRPNVITDFRDIPFDDSSDINTFISDNLQPDNLFNRHIHKALDSLCITLEKNDPGAPRVNRMIKGGSMGKGTALKGKSDLDCVMILNAYEVKDAEELKRIIETLKNQVKETLKTTSMQGWIISVDGETQFCVKFSMKSSTTTVDVDLLPTFDKNNFEVLKDLYQEMKTKDENTRQYYSAALAELQVQFVTPIPGRVKDLIRLVKYWCKKYVVPEGINDSRAVYPSSYLLELITIHAWEEAGKPDSFDMAVGFRAVMEKLRLHRELNIVWDDNYDRDQVDARIRSAPRVVDPANPFNNVYDRVNVWPRVVHVVNETLKKPFVRGVRITYGW